MKPSISKEQAVALTNPSAFRTSLLRILKNGFSSWQTHHLIPQAVWKENKTIILGGYYEKVISMGICSAEYG
jgi:hypothetical protein